MNSHFLQKKSLFKKEPQWNSKQNDLIQICKLNSKKEKQILYYTPKSSIQQGKQIFHPCDWTLNNFQVGRHLGQGKYGHVYLVRQKRTKLILALKVLSKKQILKDDIIFQLRRQIEIHSHLKHPNILKMYGFFYDQKKIYIILDYAPKGEIFKVLQEQGNFSEQKTANYIYQMIQAIKKLHSLKIIHRDIKPENILLSTNDQIKLTDFGWSIHLSAHHKKRKTFCGTPDYISPEIANQRVYDQKVDLWCLGVLTYEFAAGYPPFHDANDRKQLIIRIKQANYEFPQYFSDELKHFIASLLRVIPQQRMGLQKAQKHPWIKRYNIGNNSYDMIQTMRNDQKQMNDIEI